MRRHGTPGGRFSRRRFLQLAAVAPMATALSSRPGATARHWAQPMPRLRMWWWGEEEATGITRWVEDTVARFQADTGVSIEVSRMATDEVVAEFTTAAAARNPPDVQYLWNGIYHMENVWRGYLESLNGLVARNVLQRSGATRLSVFEGRQYRAGFYVVGYGMAYNKVLFDRAGLNPDDPPRTWDAFLASCDRLMAAGITPFGGGIKDGFFGDWYFTNGLSQNLSSPVEAISLFTGALDWREPKYHEHWVRLEELHRSGFINHDIRSWGLWESIGLFDAGRFATCLYPTAALSHAEAQLGRGNVGFTVLPVFGKGRMAGLPILDAHGFGIPSRASDKRNAARFIEYMHTKERLQAMWTLSTQIPSDEAFDSSVIDVPLLKEVYDTVVAGPHIPYIGDLMPTRFWVDVMFVASQRILAGAIGGEQAGDLAYAVTEAWKAANPDVVNNYARWGRELAQ